MISIITKSVNAGSTEVYEQIVDSELDFSDIRFYCAPGSIAYTADLVNVWLMGGDNMWHRVLIAEGGAAGGGATGGVSGLPEVQAAHMQLATNASNEAVWQPRTHYYAYEWGIVDENTLEYAAPSAGALIAAIYDRTPIESGVTYKVIWDGEEYECVAKENTLGNESIYTNTAEDTGEPFYFRPSSMRIYAKTEGQHTHVVKREMNVYHALDKRYLPEDVAYLESIPEVKPALVITVSEADGTYTTDSIASTTEISDAAQSGRPVYVKEGNAEAFKLYSLSWCEKLYNYDNYPYVFDDSQTAVFTCDKDTIKFYEDFHAADGFTITKTTATE